MLKSINIAAIVLMFTAPVAWAQNFNFGLWGDMPYEKAGDQAKMGALLDSINASNIDFSIYDGDIKDGSSKCTDNVYTDALKMFDQLKKPVFYVPGDNEWTDCHRTNNGGYNNLERLDHLRNVMFPTTESLGQTRMTAERQGKLNEKFVENIRVVHKGIVFIGLNMPGSNNNKVRDEKECTNKSARDAVQCDADNAEYADRDAANIAWMQQSFGVARERKAPGVVIVVQADPVFDLPETEGIDESKTEGEKAYDGFRNFMSKLVAETEQYAGQVLFVHGDTHFFKYDKPLYSPTNILENFTRLETFGSPSIHWVNVSVDPTSEQVFSVHPVMVKQK